MKNPFKKGILIAIEGIDGAGKTTQTELLVKWFRENIEYSNSADVLKWGFPRYNSNTGKIIKSYLKGDINLNPKETGILYAYNKEPYAESLRRLLHEGNIVITDRYVPSNLAYQTARLSEVHKKKFRKWLANLEYKVNKMPKPDYVIELRPDIADARERASSRSELDIYEDDFLFQGEVAKEYDSLRIAFGDNWITIGVRNSAEELTEVIVSILLSDTRFNKYFTLKQGWSLKPYLKFW